MARFEVGDFVVLTDTTGVFVPKGTLGRIYDVSSWYCDIEFYASHDQAMGRRQSSHHISIAPQSVNYNQMRRATFRDVQELVRRELAAFGPRHKGLDARLKDAVELLRDFRCAHV